MHMLWHIIRFVIGSFRSYKRHPHPANSVVVDQASVSVQVALCCPYLPSQPEPSGSFFSCIHIFCWWLSLVCVRNAQESICLFEGMTGKPQQPTSSGMPLSISVALFHQLLTPGPLLLHLIHLILSEFCEDEVSCGLRNQDDVGSKCILGDVWWE